MATATKAKTKTFEYSVRDKKGKLVNGKLDGTNNRELSATGLPYDRDGDGTADANTLKYTENKFRELLNIPIRPRY